MVRVKFKVRFSSKMARSECNNGESGPCPRTIKTRKSPFFLLRILKVNIEFIKNEKLETFGISSNISKHFIEYRKFYNLSIKACF